jgi:hypothetical protein
MNPVEITIRALKDAALEAADEERELIIHLAIAKREVTKLESQLVGAREKYRLAKEILRTTISSVPTEECSNREVEILRARGYVVSQGDLITPELKAVLRSIGMTSPETFGYVRDGQE